MSICEEGMIMGKVSMGIISLADAGNDGAEL